VGDALSTDVIPAKAGTQDTVPQVAAISSGVCTQYTGISQVTVLTESRVGR